VKAGIVYLSMTAWAWKISPDNYYARDFKTGLLIAIAAAPNSSRRARSEGAACG